MRLALALAVLAPLARGGPRHYNDALAHGRLAAPKADAVIAILARYTRIEDRAVYRAITAGGDNPTGT